MLSSKAVNLETKTENVKEKLFLFLSQLKQDWLLSFFMKCLNITSWSSYQANFLRFPAVSSLKNFCSIVCGEFVDSVSWS